MPVTVVFDVPGMTSAQYDAVIAQLESQGEGAPEGRLYHVANRRDGGWFVVDVWSSVEALERFAAHLMPALEQAGVAPPEPRVFEVHTVIAP